MNIICPHCEKINRIKKTKTICGSCSLEITTDKPDPTKPGVGKLLVFTALAGGGGYAFNDYIEDKRYPIKVEYALIESCLTADRASLTKKHFKDKKDLCICALNMTQEDISMDEFKNNVKSFISSLDASLVFCSIPTIRNKHQ